MKAFTTFGGASRFARGRPIIRILRDPDHIFIVVESMLNTEIQAVDPVTGVADGRIEHLALSSGQYAKLFGLIEVVRDAVGLLRSMEWRKYDPDYGMQCIECGEAMEQGHLADCALAAALKKANGL